MALRGAHADPVAHRLAWVAVLLFGAALPLDLAFSPPDRIQGQSVRLMYVHVPSAWTAFAAFGVVAVASIGVLLRKGARKEARWDTLARAAAELGVGMTALVLAEGSLWGHVVWGVWWTWDPRLVTTALLLVIYVGYLLVRALPGPVARVRRRAAVLGTVAVLQVLVVHMSVLWWRSLHQPPTLLRPSLHDPIVPSMAAPLIVSVMAFSIAGAWFVRVRYRRLMAEQAQDTTEVAPAATVAGAITKEPSRS